MEAREYNSVVGFEWKIKFCSSTARKLGNERKYHVLISDAFLYFT